MHRLFQQFTKRSVVSLDGIWKFKIDSERTGVSEKWYEKFPEDNLEVVVPGCWNNELGLYHYEGLAWYQTSFTCHTSAIKLDFHGFTGQLEIYVDGTHIAGQYGGFAGFSCVVDNLEPGIHNLVVSVDNRHNSENTIPLSRVDWFHYGGLYRSVELSELPQTWIKDYRIDYQLDGQLASASLDFQVILQSAKSEQQELKIYINDQLFCSELVTIEGETKVTIARQQFNNIKLWDIDSPNLYMVRFELANDDITERIGFRDITVQDSKLLLNNKEIKLKGVNRHEEHPDWGFAIPFKLMKKDMDIIKKLGCNTIRGSHYPNAKSFLDLCDQEGILFWEEIPMWGFPEQALQEPLTLTRGLAMHETMVKRDFHHPSIILWGMHNEIDTRTQAGYDLTNAFVNKVRELDTTRPLTYATMFPLDDICLSLVDIFSINKYLGWYDGGLEQWPNFIQALKDKLSEENLVGMPIIMSEFGAGAIYGDSTFEGPKWTENYQERVLDYTVDLFLQDQGVLGTYVWQYCDIRTAQEMEMGRPRSFNNKGIVNEYRKPKLGYWKVADIYHNY